MLYNPQDIMPDKMMDKEMINKFGWKKYLIMAIILLLIILGVRQYLKSHPQEEFKNLEYEMYDYEDNEKH